MKEDSNPVTFGLEAQPSELNLAEHKITIRSALLYFCQQK